MGNSTLELALPLQVLSPRTLAEVSETAELLSSKSAAELKAAYLTDAPFAIAFAVVHGKTAELNAFMDATYIYGRKQDFVAMVLSVAGKALKLSTKTKKFVKGDTAAKKALLEKATDKDFGECTRLEARMLRAVATREKAESEAVTRRLEAQAAAAEDWTMDEIILSFKRAKKRAEDKGATPKQLTEAAKKVFG